MSLATPYGKHLRACKKQLIERTPPMTNSPEIDEKALTVAYKASDGFEVTRDEVRLIIAAYLESARQQPQVSVEVIRERITKVLEPSWSPNWRKLDMPSRGTLSKYGFECHSAEQTAERIMAIITEALTHQGGKEAGNE